MGTTPIFSVQGKLVAAFGGTHGKKISKLKMWFDTSKLSINLNKTKLMLFDICKINTQVQAVIKFVMNSAALKGLLKVLFNADIIQFDVISSTVSNMGIPTAHKIDDVFRYYKSL